VFAPDPPAVDPGFDPALLAGLLPAPAVEVEFTPDRAFALLFAPAAIFAQFTAGGFAGLEF
jgi:hypothetical protein